MRTTRRMLLAVVLLGCAKEKAPEPPPAPPAPSAPTPAKVALSDFKHLSYLDGKWNGSMADGSHFFERYVVRDDSTIGSYTIADSTFAAASDSGAIRWSNGEVRSGEPGHSYVATVWTADSVRFEPEGRVANSFVWIRKSQDAWQARLENPTRPAPVIYEMARVRN